MGRAPLASAAAGIAGLALLAACSTGADPGAAAPPPTAAASRTSPPATDLGPSPSPGRRPLPRPADFDADRALRTVQVLAGRIGPRLATAPAFREAAAWVRARLGAAGYRVRSQAFPVPAGDSWGVPVAAGRSVNLVAEPTAFDPASPYLLVGAHLDTVAVAPGAEDNASGVAVLLELARLLGGRGQVVLVAFGGEEPRGPGDLHHFGSRHLVGSLGPAARRLRGMVALDRVGVGTVVPLSSVPGTPTVLRDALAAAADRVGVRTVVGTDTASDHESFADAGHLAARVGSTPYAGYHSATDVPPVVRRDQLARVGRLLTAWLAGSPVAALRGR